MPARSDRRRGFSLVELLVSVAVSGVALASVAKFFANQNRLLQGHAFRVEAQQGLRSSLDAISRDVRLAGACLPATGAFVALTGTNGANAPDSITVRTGVLRADLSCVVATVTANMNAGATTATVDSVNGFAVGQLVYLTAQAGNGQYQFVTAVGGNTVTLDGGATTAYTANAASLYAIDERKYAVNTAVQPNQLTLTINRAAAEPFAAGFRDLQLQYILNQNCPTCTVVDLPPDTATWRLVNAVLVTASVQTVGAVRTSDVVTLTETTEVKPRNLLP